MKRFTEYLNEDFDTAIFNHDGGISIKDPSVVDAINSNLELATGCDCRTPYIALEEIRKILAYYKIFIPKSIFLDQNHGNDVFEVSQFGEKMGMNNQGEVVTANDSPLFVYFEWSLNEKGMYDIFTCLCDQEELDEILADYDSEVESDEDIQEEVMPDPKKKMGAKKVTLSNMMRKEETLNELRGKGSVDKEDLKKHIAKKHDAAWEKTREKRKKNKSSGSADTRDEDKHRNRLAKMYNKLKEEKKHPFYDIPAPETKTPDVESKSKIKKITKRLAKKGMMAKKK